MGSHLISAAAAQPPGGRPDIDDDSKLQNALVHARRLLDIALRQNRSWQVDTQTLAEYFETTEELREVASANLLDARREVLCVAHDGWYSDTWLDAICDRISTLIARGVRVRKLCQPDEWTGWFRGEHQLREFAERGMAIRVAENRLDEMFMIDGRVAFLRVKFSATEHHCLAVRSVPVLKNLDALFTATWNSAHEPDTYAWRRGHLDETGVKILGYLSAGCKDDAAARELGWSVRTYRRYVARIMRDLNANSRFQAGVRAAELGLVNVGDRRSDPGLNPSSENGSVIHRLPSAWQVADTQVCTP
jgi:DNA-binding CsgD family transcriptional regulator